MEVVGDIRQINKSIRLMKEMLPTGARMDVARIAGVHFRTVDNIMAGNNRKLSENVVSIYEAVRHILIVRLDELNREREIIERIVNS